MDATRFDGFARSLSARLSRRTSLSFLAGASLPLLSLGDATNAKKKKKVTLCFNGQTITKPKKKAKKLQKQGATKGACPDGCATGQRPCGDTCISSTNCCDTDDCTGDDVCENGSCAPLRCGNGGPCTVFVTSQTFLGTDFGGLDAADTKCTSLANDAYPGLTFRAWLSDNTQTPGTRFDHIDRAGPWLLPHNEIIDGDDPPPTVATNFNDLITCPGGECLQHGIDRDQDGVEVGLTSVWTGTNADGSAHPENCFGWTDDGSTDELGRYGFSSRTNAEWTNVANYDCDAGGLTLGLYCFQQAT